MSIERLPQSRTSEKPKASGHARVCAVPALVALAILGASACTREVVVKETPASSTTTSSSSIATTPSVTVSPVSDRSKLCSRAWGRSFEIWDPSDAYWKAVQKSGFGSSEVNDAGDKFREAVVKALPSFKGLVGAEAPKDVADAISAYAEAADKFSEAAGAHSSEEELNPLASAFGHAVDRFKEVCGKG